MISTEARSFPASYAHTRRLSSHADKINRSLVRAPEQTIGISENLARIFILQLITTHAGVHVWQTSKIVLRNQFVNTIRFFSPKISPKIRLNLLGINFYTRLSLKSRSIFVWNSYDDFIIFPSIIKHNILFAP